MSQARWGLSRRRFLASATAAGGGLVMPQAFAITAPAKRRLRVLSIGVMGMGAADRSQVAAHGKATIVGLCDVDSANLAEAARHHPRAFQCRDYREAFDQHHDKFDAVIVAVPDHSHATLLLTALQHDKHVYGQKPLVHGLAELAMVELALKAKPGLVTQLGNQRMSKPGRRAAVEILRRGMLGKAIEAHVWIEPPGAKQLFTGTAVPHENPAIPPNLDWNLWLGPCAERPYCDDVVPGRWRSWWDFGSAWLGDWGCHMLDVILLAFDELGSPVGVKSECPEPSGPVHHVNPVKSTLIYRVNSAKFAHRTFPIHYHDSGQAASLEEMRVGTAPKGNYLTVVVCEGGTLALEVEGRVQVWRDGKWEEGLRMPGLPEFPPLNHWHAWVDACLGQKAEVLTPFKEAVRITEPVLLGVKAARFPGQELHWDKSKLAFTNHREATQTIVRRTYREGFAPPRVG